jgi:hypothetical protein
MNKSAKLEHMKNWIIRTFGLKGSWKWAKKQMMKGEMVRCKHWTGALKYRVKPEMINDVWGENPTPSTLLQANYTRKNIRAWETSNHHLSFEDFTDYEVFHWD